MPTFTEEQARAIETRKSSVALSAGAGCGKTFVLTERFLTHLDPRNSAGLEPADLSELVAITFTDRAAREMRERIRLKCYQRLQAATGEEAAYWLALLRAMDRARVSTIHAFCASLLRSHAVEAGLDPQFAVFEQSQADTVLAELIDDQLRAGLSALDDLTLDLVADFGLERLRSAIQSLLTSWHDMDAERWLAMTADEQVTIWETFHAREIMPLICRQVAGGETAQTLLAVLRSAQIGHAVMLERKAILCDLLTGLPMSKNPRGDLEAIREAAKVQGGGTKKDWGSEEDYEQFRDAATKIRGEIDGWIKKCATFDFDAALPAAEAGLRLCRLTAGVVAAYEQRKRELGVLDFGDLMVRAHRLLTSPHSAALRERLSGQIQLLLVDEFQDTDPLQVELVKALCGEGLTAGKLFFVGDYKQSIYRFRGADPQVFRALQDVTPSAGRLPLTLNFRSQPAIIEFVNALFCQPFGATYEPLRANRPQVNPNAAIEFLWAQLEPEVLELSKGSVERLRRCEADWIARRLRAMLDDGEMLIADHATPGEARPVKLGDIAILFRALSDVQFYEQALQSYGIDYYLVGGHAFYAQQEVYDLLNLLRSLVSPGDEVSLVGALRSPFFSLSDETLYWLSRHARGLSGGLFAAEPPAVLDADARRRVQLAAQTLRELREVKDRLPIATLIQECLARTGYDAVLLAEFMGERKLANLRKLVDQARGFDNSGLMGLSDFIVQLSRFVADQPREPLAATHPESTDVLRLMTIHQSKGLEFPVVVVPDLSRASQGSENSVVVSRELGPLVRRSDVEATTGHDLHQAINSEQDREELVRLFYVACTRAADYLILSSGVADLEKPKGDWQRLLAKRFELATGELMSELPKNYRPPRVRVTLERPPTKFKQQGKTRRKDWEAIVQKACDLAQAGKAALPPAVSPLAADQTARRQYSFSRLTGKLHARAAISAGPTLDEGDPPPERLDPLGLGSLTHAVLEKFHYLSEAELLTLVERLAPQHFDNPERAIAEVSQWVERFCRSARAADLRVASVAQSELEFLLAWPPEPAPASGRYLQGFIDCLYQDAAGGWHILDYKTNRVTPAQLPETAAVYEMQLYVYALAAEQVLGEPPVDLVLHFLQPGLEHVFPWNAAAKARVVDLVERAIAANLVPEAKR